MKGKTTCIAALSVAGILVLSSCGYFILQPGEGKQAPAPTPTAAGPVNLDEDPQLVGWWKLDGASGKTAADSSKHGRNGTLQGDVSFNNDSVAGRIGKALKLDADDFIQVTGYKGILGTGPRTIAAWVKTDRGGGEIMSWGQDAPGRKWTFRVVGSGIRVDPQGGYLYTNERVHDNEWHHVAAVVRAGNPPALHDHATLYRDGKVSELHDIGLLHMYGIETAADQDVMIGRGFRGVMDDVRLYDRALSADEIEALFQQN